MCAQEGGETAFTALEKKMCSVGLTVFFYVVFVFVCLFYVSVPPSGARGTNNPFHGWVESVAI